MNFLAFYKYYIIICSVNLDNTIKEMQAKIDELNKTIAVLNDRQNTRIVGHKCPKCKGKVK